MKAKNKLEDLDIYEVSLVGSPANKRKYLLVKSEGGQEVTEDTIVLETELTEEQTNAIKGALNILGKHSEGMSEKLKSAIAVLADAAGIEGAAKPDKDKEKYPYGYPQKKEVEKAIAQVEKTLRAEIEKARGEAEALRQQLEAKELEEVQKSSGIEMDWLKTLREHLPEAEFRKAVDREMVHQRRLKEAGLFKEIGSSASGEQEAGDKLLSIVNNLVVKGTDRRQAWDIVAKENPDLYREYTKGRNRIKEA